MKVTLNVVSRNNPGRKIWLRTGQEIEVGRTVVADLGVAHDQQMSGLHFALECGKDVCRIHDRQSETGTFLNGVQIDSSELFDGDRIEAGETVFVVRIEGGSSASARLKSVQVTDDMTAEPREGDVSSLTYRKDPCHSGLTLFRGLPPVQAVDVARRCAQLFPLFLVIDCMKTGIPTDPDGADYLYGWLPSEILAQTSPVIISAKEASKTFDLLEAGWGKDGVICLYSREEEEILRDHLRSMARYYASESEQADAAVLAFGWPSILAPLLAHGDPGFATAFFARVDAVLMETESPDSWLLFGKSELEQDVVKMGFNQEATLSGS
jgi:pSer/pThr/pTyr-binding forkhead associated (FHA) protein